MCLGCPAGSQGRMSPVSLGCCGRRVVCSRGSTVGECWACGIRALASCALQSQGDTLAVFCGCVNAGLLAELVQSKLECSEKPFRLCSIPQLCAMTLRTACCCLFPHFIPNSSAAGVSFMYKKVGCI